MKWLRDLFRKKEEPKEQPPEVPKESVPSAAAEPSEPIASLSFVSDPPTVGAWLETMTDGQTLYLPLLRSPLILGSSAQCDVVFNERFSGAEKVAAQHARLELWRERWVIAPLSQGAPVFVNGKRTGENALKDGMEVTLGEGGVRLVFRVKE